MYYDPESRSHGQWSRKRKYSTVRPGGGRRGHLGEDGRRRGEDGPVGGGGAGGGQTPQQEDKVEDHSKEEDDQKEQHQKQRYNGLLNASCNVQAGSQNLSLNFPFFILFFFVAGTWQILLLKLVLFILLVLI